MTSNNHDDLRCGASTPTGTCRNIGTFADGRCSRHTDRETNPLRETHKALVEDEATICSGCGQLFASDAAYESHDCPQSQTSKTKKVKEKAKAGGKKAAKNAKDGGKRGFVYLFDEKDEQTAIVLGLTLGYMWGHDPMQAYTLLGIATGAYAGGMGSSAKSKFPIPRAKLRQIGKNTVQLIGSFLVAVGVIIVYHDPTINAPEFYYEFLEQLWGLLGLAGLLSL